MKNIGVMLLFIFIVACPAVTCAGWIDEVNADSSAASEKDSMNLETTEDNKVASNEDLFRQIVGMVQSVDLEFETGKSSGESGCANTSDKCEEPKNVDESN